MYRMILNETSYHGKGAVKALVPEIKKHNFQKALLVTDPGLIEFKVIAPITELLDSNNCEYEIFSDILANPTVENVQAGVEAFKKSGADYIIAVGGGSPQDAAKAIGIIINNPEFADVVSLEGLTPSKKPSVPLIAIGTTAGTASETTINYVITDTKNKRKFVCVDPHDIPKIAIVDPELMYTMPRGLTVASGMDALTHAIEGYITKGAWELTDCLNLKAIEIIGRSLRSAADNEEAGREGMALGQFVTGMAFSNCGLGVVHSLAHPLSAHYGIAHGIANAVLLPYVMEFNAPASGSKYRDIAKALGVQNTEAMTEAEYRQAAIDAVKQLTKDLEVPATLEKIGVKEEDLDILVSDALKDACTPGNPRECTHELLLAVMQKAFKGC